ncbi:hypothetical protein VOLCADRAFT_108657 [Volvox carteri f. nagariensis]|uniref:Uncharacterized protein n=1 Tax=Volvox carteri f. nagariensis TaxID=3068 RepID=D8ULL9_VOLCA|nr:uncharacterized protein VOLCADRAFT_108657 [Volvox carteri f. nagariensis]EFJ39380.1 hypothetical protein VOLCADRAFT_108657 [Volvox carteri f. nagariensis]|eukprot:XP_002959555.1 hypothetical protein VOLCADRAFT_108657 [Volvox carteri f. nagariensis]
MWIFDMHGPGVYCLQDDLVANELLENTVVTFNLAGCQKAYSVIVVDSNQDGSVRTYPGNQPHPGFTYCMACNYALWPTQPPPKLVPASESITGKLWDACDRALRGIAATMPKAAAVNTADTTRVGGAAKAKGGRSGGAHHSSSGSGLQKQGCTGGENCSNQVSPPPPALPAVCLNGPEPSEDVAKHKFFNGLAGWMPSASSKSPLANIRAHVKAKTHIENMHWLRLLARSGAGHFSWLRKPIAGVRLCPYAVPLLRPKAEPLLVLDSTAAPNPSNNPRYDVVS